MGNRPAYEGIKSALKASIAGGELPEGARLPSEHELAEQYGVSRNQSRKALRELELEGYVLRAQGRRSVVAPANKRRNGLAMFTKQTIAIALPEYCSLYVRTILNAIIARLSHEGYQSVAYNLAFDEASEPAFLQQILDSEAGGLAIWLQRESLETRRLVGAFQEAGVPIVLVDRYLPGIETDFVVADNEALGYHLTKALLDRGHERIGYVSGPRPVTSSEERVAGYLKALKEAGHDYGEALRIVLPEDERVAAASVDAIMALRDAPTAFTCSHDALAEALISQAQRLGYRIPEDLEIATLDDERSSGKPGVPLITVRQNAQDIGDQAAEVLLARIRDPRRPFDQRFVRTVVERECLAELSP